MDKAALYKTIYDRGHADNGGATALFNGSAAGLITGIFNNSPPSTALFPFVVYNLSSSTAQHMFTMDMFKFQFRLQTYVGKWPEDGSDALLTGSNILVRLFGDTSGGSVGTRGFHRWQPTLSGSWTSTLVMQTGDSEEHGEEYYCWANSYECWVKK